MSKSQSTLDPDKLMAAMKIFPSEPLGKTSTITHKKADKGLSVAICGSGTVTDWKPGEHTVLLTSNVRKCMTVALATLERGFLFPMALNSKERIDQGLNVLCTWWSENRDSFTSGRLFVVMSDWAVYADAYAKAHAPVPEVEKLTNLKAKVKNWHDWPEDNVKLVWLFDNGTGNMPAVMYNKKIADPTAPLSDDDSRTVQKMWEQLRLSS